MIPWVHPSQHPKWHLDQFSCFCGAHKRDQQSDQPMDRVGYFVRSNSPLAQAITVMWPNNNNTAVKCSNWLLSKSSYLQIIFVFTAVVYYG